MYCTSLYKNYRICSDEIVTISHSCTVDSKIVVYQYIDISKKDLFNVGK
ncbi:hypothetical protein KCTCHS21_25270 [Cohnella abietis]|uniref:Uncharacterized protein n=1 Tax=Cohnella abietis TaxID=2507935 RepID=A0A3T1D510_9BACL|nr:hypothetical protein KCTCHS21_25270 [Cohnella abietis]